MDAHTGTVKTTVKIESDDMQFPAEEGQANKDLGSKLIKQQPGTGKNDAGVQKQQMSSDRQEKFSEFLKTEKLRKYKRMPRVYNQRSPVPMKCPSCGKERETRTRYEMTGSQWCTCILCCWLGGYIFCCIPFCIRRCYNVRHSCHDCYYMIGESGV